MTTRGLNNLEIWTIFGRSADDIQQQNLDNMPSVAELAGYWAETQIFGGVVLFDRGESGEECNGMYIHNTRRNTTIAPSTEQQSSRLIESFCRRVQITSNVHFRSR
ncbi:hypothetical protein N8I77_003055 [Diaporthe amygdali]|uniref:Uncharacterized protein n=1 Tax=Phomopsis amygdali TaxID=1214568 RepID=A0AAD9SJ49_PHOAM|nr:hypothetical protein N8I77_003055 [Diaporthe amygdali]